MRTFYGINFWLKDSSDFRDIDGYTRLRDAVSAAKRRGDIGLFVFAVKYEPPWWYWLDYSKVNHN